MDQTRIKSEHAASQALTPVEGAALPDAYRRAPTLMAGQQPGSQGPVQVWSPSAWRNALSLTRALLLILLIVAIRIPGGLLHPGILSILMMGVLLAITVIPLVLAFRRRCYLTTDVAGIGITTAKGTRALRWEEIQELQDRLGLNLFELIGGIGCYPRLILKAPEQIELNLSGYSRAVQRDILHLILDRTGLKPDFSDPTRYRKLSALIGGGRPGKLETSRTRSLPRGK